MFGNNEIEEWKSGITILMRKILKKNLHLETKIDRKLYMLKVNSVSVSKVYLERKKRNVNQ